MHAVWLKSPDQLDGDPMTRLKDGQQFGRFQITGALGRGGMAAVYRAYEPRLDREVALKVLSSDLTEQEGFAERFEREARLIAKLEHPNIVPVYASGIEDGTPWIALRFVSGGSLQERLESDPPKRAEGLDIFRAVASGLDFAHRAGVLCIWPISASRACWKATPRKLLWVRCSARRSTWLPSKQKANHSPLPATATPSQ
mgnify:CR=1 FL=1